MNSQNGPHCETQGMSVTDSSMADVRTSRMAISSLILGILGFVIPVFIASLGLILGIVGLRKINKSQGVLKGRNIAISGAIVSGASLLLWLLLVIILLGYILYTKVTVPVFEKTGGYSIVCQVGDGEQLDNSTIDEVCMVLKKRLDPYARLGIIIRRKEYRLIEICVPVCEKDINLFDHPENLVRMLKGAGTLEFRILPTEDNVNITELESYRDSLVAKGPNLVSDSKYKWCEIADTENWRSAGITGQFGEKLYVLCSNQRHETLLRNSEEKWKLKKAYPTSDQMGRQAVGFVFDDVAAEKFFRLTRQNISRPLCILLDDRAISAPNINSAIRSSGVITGSFTATEVLDMVNKLNAGSLPVPVIAMIDTIEWTSPDL